MPQDHIPLQATWPLLQSPDVLENFIVERVDTSKTGYVRLAPGDPHPNRTTHPGYRLADEKNVQGSDTLVMRFWSTDEAVPDVFNYSISYSGESVSHPIWARRYRVARNSYTALTMLSAFTGVFQIRVTASGSGYTTAPTVSFSGGGGTGATAVAVLDKGGGTVAWVRITAEGTGYTSAPTVAFTGGGGTGAAATAVVQGAAKLVHQELQPLPQDDPRASLWTTVLRVWETLPGPPLAGIEYNRERANGAKVDTSKQKVVAGTATDDPTFASGILESRVTPIDSNVSVKENVTLASGVNQPILHGTHIDEQTGICVDYTAQFVAEGAVGGVGHVRSLAINAAGSGYTAGTYDLTVSGGGGSGATAKATVAGGAVSAVTLTYGGAGYTSDPTFVLPAGAGAGTGSTFTVLRGNGYVEIQRFDKWMSIAITSVMRDGTNGTGTSTIPADKTYGVTARESFPNVLKDLVLLTISGTTDDQSTAGYNLIEGYAGEVQGRMTVKYMTDANYITWSATDTIHDYSPVTKLSPVPSFAFKPKLTQFFPQANRVSVTRISDGYVWATRDYPMSLHGAYEATIFDTFTIGMPATVPTDIPYDTWIVKSIKEERWRFGYWQIEILEILVPPNFQTGV